MAYVTGFEHDVFVSYAVVDDEKEHGVETGWVTAFMKSLEAQLAKSMGRLGRLQPWWDRRNLAKNAPIDDQIRKALESTACMVVIFSKGYLESDWCRIEREIFLGAVAKQQRSYSRIFIVDQGSVAEHERRELFNNILPFELFKRDTVSGNQLLGYPEPDPKQHREYYSEVNRLAGQLKREFDLLSDPLKTTPSENDSKDQTAETGVVGPSSIILVHAATGSTDGNSVVSPTNVSRLAPRGKREVLLEQLLNDVRSLHDSIFAALCVQFAFKSSEKASPRESFVEELFKTRLDKVVNSCVKIWRNSDIKDARLHLKTMLDRLIPLVIAETALLDCASVLRPTGRHPRWGNRKNADGCSVGICLPGREDGRGQRT